MAGDSMIWPLAFPVSEQRNANGDIVRHAENGMSLTDWFAGHIASGMAAHSGTMGSGFGPGEIALRSYRIADALMAERERRQGGAA